MSKIMMTESNAGKFSSHGTRSVALLMTPKKFYGLISVLFLFLIVTTAALFWVHYQSAAEQLCLDDHRQRNNCAWRIKAPSNRLPWS